MNNKEESLSLWQGLMLALKRNINKLLLIGDSMIFFRNLVPKHGSIDGPLSLIIRRIFHLIKYVEELKCYHALQILNFLTDINANLACNLSHGKLIHGGEVDWNIHARACIREIIRNPLLRDIMQPGILEPN